MKSRYDLMQDSQTLNEEFNTFFKDPLTFPFDSFPITTTPLKYTITNTDIIRPDLLVYRAYGKSFYDDIIMILNEIDDWTNLNPGDTIYLPSIGDLEKFYKENLQ
jgi:hypothetical protein